MGFQRLEKLKKNAFASACLFGKDNDSSISGIWVFKGQELAFPLSDDWTIDYASYDWNKWIPNLKYARSLFTSTGSGKVQMRRAEHSTRARSSSNSSLNTWFLDPIPFAFLHFQPHRFEWGCECSFVCMPGVTSK